MGSALARLCALEGVGAVVAFGSRARGGSQPDSDLDLAVIMALPSLAPEEKALCWLRCLEALGSIGVGVDVVVVGSADAE